MSRSPVHKRLRLDPSASPPTTHEIPIDNSNVDSQGDGARPAGVEEDEEHCVICLQQIRDRTLLPCAHDRMCFECILVWTGQSRKCPLCNAPIGPFLIHNIRSKYDYQKRFLPPLRSLSPPNLPPLLPLRNGNSTRSGDRSVSDRWGTRSRRSASQERQAQEDELELAIQRRRWVYRHGLFAKHVASNPFTRYRPAPLPAQVASSPETISRATIFIRRELRVWVNLDVEFLTTFILSLMKSLDLRSESAVKLLAEFLDMDTPYHVGTPSESSERFKNAEHFAHELYSYLRSPFRELSTYDRVVQYDVPEHLPPMPTHDRDEIRRWDFRSPARGETSSRRRRRHSSPPPLSHSPRDAYSHSPPSVPSNSHEMRTPHDSTRRPTLADHTCSPQQTPGIVEGRNEGEASERKGKDREIVVQSPERGAFRGANNRSQRSSANAPSMKSSKSPEEISVREECCSIQDGQDCQSQIDFPRRGASGDPDNRGRSSKGTSRRRSSVRNNVSTNSNKSTIISSHHDENSAENSLVVSDQALGPAKLEEWGISIKGQARLLEQKRASETEHGKPTSGPGINSERPENPRTRDGTRSPNSDGYCAKIDRDSETAEALNDFSSTATVMQPDAEGDKHETRFRSSIITRREDHPITIQNVGSEDMCEEGVRGDNDHLPADAASPSIKTQRSVPEIMARTRAKIARLKGKADVASASETSRGAKESPPLGSGDERQSAIPSEVAINSRHRSDGSKYGGSTAYGVKSTRLTYDEGLPTGDSADLMHAESKLRMQALLRVRLAAEKKRLQEGQMTSRENTLREKLLSRRV